MNFLCHLFCIFCSLGKGDWWYDGLGQEKDGYLVRGGTCIHCGYHRTFRHKLRA